MWRTGARLRAAWRFIVRVARTGKVLATSRELPVWLRAMFLVMLTVTQVAIGPLDDILLLLPFGIAYVFYRPVIVRAWSDSATAPVPATPATVAPFPCLCGCAYTDVREWLLCSDSHPSIAYVLTVA